MAVVIIQEWRNASPSTDNYDAIGEKLRSEGKLEPEGLLVHTAGFDGDTFRILEVWESKEQHERFLNDTLMPAIQSTADETAQQPEMRDYELHNFARPGAG
jgi:quinol monooxygenase YgiN